MTTEPSASRSWAPLAAVIGFSCVMMVLLTYLLLPAPRVDTQVADTTIVFSASRGAVLFPNDCITLTWDVFNTQAVRVNGELLPAQGQQELCVSGTVQPVIAVTLLDGSEQAFPLRVIVLSGFPLVLILTLLGVCLLVGAGVVLLVNLVRRIPGVEAVVQSAVLRSMVRGVVWAGVAAGVSLWLVDMALSGYFRAYGTREQKIMYVYSVEEIRLEESRIVHVPYVSYLPNPLLDEHNALGYRGEEIAIPKPDGVYRIVALGGSTTYSTGTTAQESYPALLQQILRDDYGYANVEVVNGGFLGYTSWEILATFAFRVLTLQPDMILYYGGVNDLVVRERASTDCYAGLNAMRGLNPERGLFVERADSYPSSTLLRFMGVNLGWLPNPLVLDSAFEPPLIDCNPDPADMTIERRLELNAPIYFERNLSNLIALANANGVQPVFSSWAYNTEADRPELWRSEIAAQNDLLAALAERTDTPFYDLVANFPVNAAFWELDGIHMLEAGTREQARQYAAFLDSAGLLPR